MGKCLFVDLAFCSILPGKQAWPPRGYLRVWGLKTPTKVGILGKLLLSLNRVFEILGLNFLLYIVYVAELSQVAINFDYNLSTKKSWEETQIAIQADREADVTKKINRRVYRDENKKVNY